MDLIASLGLGFSVALDPMNILYCFIGVLLGTLVGVLPGLVLSYYLTDTLGVAAGLAGLVPLFVLRRLQAPGRIRVPRRMRPRMRRLCRRIRHNLPKV